jgi:hypothetical protein
MEPMMKNPVSAPASNGARFAELVDDVRGGDPGAIKKVQHLLGPGVRFLLQQRVRGSDVDPHARSVLEATIQAIRDEPSIAPGDVVRLVRQLIVRRFPARLRESGQGQHGTGIRAAERILKGMSPVERDALRRCYVLGEAPESFFEDLKLTPVEFRALQCRARARFSARRQPTANVA